MMLKSVKTNRQKKDRSDTPLRKQKKLKIMEIYNWI